MIMSFGIAAILALVAVGTLATATTRAPNQTAVASASINPFELMTNSKDLPAPQYAEPL